MEEAKTQGIIGAPEKSIPKFATGVNFSKLENGNIILAFLNKSSPDSPAVLIESVIVDEDHARKILEVLTKVLNEKI
ncbi:hypothetical protein EBT25_05835 [bacterium]|nr:hypothetical protein [bacterium]